MNRTGLIVGGLGLAITVIFSFASIPILLETIDGEVVAESSTREVTFSGEWNQYYDIFSLDKNATITFTAETGNYDSEFTYLKTCKQGGAIAMSGTSISCSDPRNGEWFFVGEFTVGALDGGQQFTINSSTDGIQIVAVPVSGALGFSGLICVGCCIGPIVLIIGVVLSFRSKNQIPSNVLILHQNPVVTPPQMQIPVPNPYPGQTNQLNSQINSGMKSRDSYERQAPNLYGYTTDQNGVTWAKDEYGNLYRQTANGFERS